MPRCEPSALWRVSLFVFLALLLTLASSRPAHADTWSPGQVITYTQTDWAAGGSASSLLADYYLTVYPTATVVTGQPIGGFVDIFDNPASISAYLPTVGIDAPLDSDYIDPASDSSGSLGGAVLALKLDVDFSDAGVTLGSSGIPFGDLVLENVALVPSADGLTVRQFLADANTDLGGGTSPFTVVQAEELALGLEEAFDGGTPSTFAQDSLVPPNGAGGGTSMPEPSSVLLLGAGLLGLGILQHKRRGTHPTFRAALKP